MRQLWAGYVPATESLSWCANRGRKKGVPLKERPRTRIAELIACVTAYKYVLNTFLLLENLTCDISDVVNVNRAVQVIIHMSVFGIPNRNADILFHNTKRVDDI